MKKTMLVALLSAFILLSNSTQAQAFQKGVKVFGFGLGASNMMRIDVTDNAFYNRVWWRYTGQINIQGEFGIHDYVGLGFTTGVGFAGGGGGRFGFGYSYSPEVNVPVGALCNFHFYQLIADKVSKDIHSDKLDVYVGITLGSGLAVVFDDYYNRTDIYPLLFVGPHVGARYYFNDKIGVGGEVGYGRYIANASLFIKMGG